MSGPRSQEYRTLALLGLLVAAPVVGYLAWDLGQAGKLVLKAPWALLLLLALPLAVWALVILRPARRPALRYSAASLAGAMRPGLAARLAGLPSVLRVVAFGLIVFALAQPQTRDRGGRVQVEGIDIMLALDMSNSMEATDLAPNRLEAAKRVIDDFISRRSSDRLGLVVFGREAYTQCPLTLDYSVQRTMLAELRLGMIDGSATAIGNALGVSLSRLRSSDAKSRVVILLTDGESNAGNVSPGQAARYAQAMGVKVFTILMGAGDAPVEGGRDVFGRPIRVRRQYPVNSKLLQEIAAQSGGRSFLASDAAALQQTFQKILDELEKSTRRDVAAVFTEAYRPFVALALALLLLELLLSLTRLRQLP